MSVCARKRSWLTRANARRAVKTMMSRGSLPMKHYKCEYCQLWHITSWPKKRMNKQQLAELQERKDRWREKRSNK